MIPLVLGLAGIAGTAWIASEANLIDLEDIGEEIGETIGETMAGVIKAVPAIIEEVGPAIVDGLSASVSATREALRGREHNMAAGLTIVVISITAWWAVKGMLLTPKPAILE